MTSEIPALGSGADVTVAVKLRNSPSSDGSVWADTGAVGTMG